MNCWFIHIAMPAILAVEKLIVLGVPEMENLVTRATLPFKILQDMQIPAAYERSFKIDRRGIFANRYMLVLQRRFLGVAVDAVLGELGCPEETRDEIKGSNEKASMAAIGCEEANGNLTYRFYLDYHEYVTEQRKRISKDFRKSLLAFQGWKWTLDGSHSHRSDYWQEINLSKIDLIQLIETTLGTSSFLTAHVQELIGDLCADTHWLPTVLLAKDTQSTRSSFDLNLYEQQKKVVDFHEFLQLVSDGFQLPTELLRQLMEITGNQLLGHISAGFSSHESEFVTVYFDPSPS